MVGGDPKDVVEKDVIKRLVDIGTIVIASGGGGIPVRTCPDGCLEGVKAISDKDLASEKLAEAVD